MKTLMIIILPCSLAIGSQALCETIFNFLFLIIKVCKIIKNIKSRSSDHLQYIPKRSENIFPQNSVGQCLTATSFTLVRAWGRWRQYKYSPTDNGYTK